VKIQNEKFDILGTFSNRNTQKSVLNFQIDPSDISIKGNEDMKIIGRKKEIGELMRLYQSGKPELVTVYGRRRVGKTFLINALFADKTTFSHTGVSPDDLEKSGEKKMKLQLSAFYGSLLSQGMRPSKNPAHGSTPSAPISYRLSACKKAIISMILGRS